VPPSWSNTSANPYEADVAERPIYQISLLQPSGSFESRAFAFSLHRRKESNANGKAKQRPPAEAD
jgi:hypothetical protein